MYHFSKIYLQKQNANLLISFGLKGRQKTRDIAARQLTTHAGPDTCHRNENNLNHGQETKDLVLMQFMRLNLQNIDM